MHGLSLISELGVDIFVVVSMGELTAKVVALVRFQLLEGLIPAGLIFHKMQYNQAFNSNSNSPPKKTAISKPIPQPFPRLRSYGFLESLG
jgi:hypothetical protein